MIYLDNNATTRMAEEVKKAMWEENFYANASSMHIGGRQASKIISQSREKVAQAIGAKESEIIFTSGATESNNTVFMQNWSGRIITSVIEHPSIIECAKYLKSKGKDLSFISVDENGRVKLDELEKELKKGNVSLVSIMAANNESGAIQPYAEACLLAHQYGALFHTDATQIIGKEKIDVTKSDIDFLSLSAHKFYGPKGIGALFVKDRHKITPYIHGGHQENGLRAGTYNTDCIYGMGVAIELAVKDMDEENKRLTVLKNILKEGIKKTIPNILINSPEDNCLAGTLNVSFLSAEGESILLLLDNEGICVSTGSACATGSLEPSYVLLSQGVPIEAAHGSIRFSLGRYNTKEEIEKVLSVLPEIIKKLRSYSMS